MQAFSNLGLWQLFQIEIFLQNSVNIMYCKLFKVKKYLQLFGVNGSEAVEETFHSTNVVSYIVQHSRKLNGRSNPHQDLHALLRTFGR